MPPTATSEALLQDYLLFDPMIPFQRYGNSLSHQYGKYSFSSSYLRVVFYQRLFCFSTINAHELPMMCTDMTKIGFRLSLRACKWQNHQGFCQNFLILIGIAQSLLIHLIAISDRCICVIGLGYDDTIAGVCALCIRK